MATAQVYIKRFYIKVEIRKTNPYLVMATAVYLACKMEECPQHIRLIAQEARALWPGDLHNHDTSKIGECEFWLISELNSQLIIHQPYRTLTVMQSHFGLSQEEMALAWSVVNDHFMTDLPLLYPPHIIAFSAILFCLVFQNKVAGTPNPGAPMGLSTATAALTQAHARQAAMASSGAGAGGSGASTPTPGSVGSSLFNMHLSPQVADNNSTESAGGAGGGGRKSPNPGVLKVQRFAKFLAESTIDVEGMIDCVQELIAFYECHEMYNDKQTRDMIARFIKARGLDRAT